MSTSLSFVESATNAASGIKSAASAASAADVWLLIKPFTPDALANGLATLIGALLGAMLAYFLQRKFQSIQDKNAELMSAHRMMFALLHQINTLLIIQKDHVCSKVDDPGRFISIPALSPFDVEKNVLRMEDLSFLIGSLEGRALLYELYMAQENYVEALKLWNLRSTMHSQQLQPAMAAANISNGVIVTHEFIQKAIGTLAFTSMVNTTDNTLEASHRAFMKLRAVKSSARAYVVERFKSNDFTDFDITETYGLETPPSKNKQ